MSLPKKIKAVGIHKHGDLDVIEDLELQLPVPAPDEILIKVTPAAFIVSLIKSNSNRHFIVI